MSVKALNREMSLRLVETLWNFVSSSQAKECRCRLCRGEEVQHRPRQRHHTHSWARKCCLRPFQRIVSKLLRVDKKWKTVLPCFDCCEADFVDITDHIGFVH